MVHLCWRLRGETDQKLDRVTISNNTMAKQYKEFFLRNPPKWKKKIFTQLCDQPPVHANTVTKIRA